VISWLWRGPASWLQPAPPSAFDHLYLWLLATDRDGAVTCSLPIKYDLLAEVHMGHVEKRKAVNPVSGGFAATALR
jgi:hypothetical protein